MPHAKRGARRPPASTAPALWFPANALPRPRPSGILPGRGAPQSPRDGPARPAHGPLSGVPMRRDVARSVPRRKAPPRAASRAPRPSRQRLFLRTDANLPACRQNARACAPGMQGQSLLVSACAHVTLSDTGLRTVFPGCKGIDAMRRLRAPHRARNAPRHARGTQRSGDATPRMPRRQESDPARVLRDAVVQLRLTPGTQALRPL